MLTFLGRELVEFLSARARPKVRCGPGQMFRMRCQLAHRVALNQAEIVHASPVSFNLRALCNACTAVMHRRVSRARLAADMPGVTVQDKQAQ